MSKFYTYLSLSFVLLLFTSCSKEDSKPETPKTNTIPEFYLAAPEADYGKNQPGIKLIADYTSRLSQPQDLDFNTDPARPNELWIINKGTSGTTVMLTNPGTPTQAFDYREDGNAMHFMTQPSGIAFSPNFKTWATCPNVLDANYSGTQFTGPTLWSSDLNIYARPSGGNGSHIDMLHQSPYSMGIAAEKDNIFWLFDGYNRNIVRYDFAADHGPGNDYHGDGKVYRYVEVSVLREPTVPSHLILDANKKWLYIVDGGNKRILRMDITTGTKADDIVPYAEPLAEYWRMQNVTWEVFIDAGLQKPCGIDIADNRLFVSDYQTGEIICYDINSRKILGRFNTGKSGITGIKIYNGRIWFVNALESTCMQVEPK